MSAHFTPALFAFLRDLKRHNDREWFAANKQRYVDDVEAPMLAFVKAFGDRLRGISRCYVADARRMGGSMSRIYRDTRFSADKSPFKTHVAAKFPHEARRKVENVPGFYLSLSAQECYGGGGVYHTGTPALTKIRQRIVEAPQEWQAVLDSGVEIEGDRLKRPPAGFKSTDPFVEDLKRKDLYGLAEFTQDDVVADGFLDRYTEACQRVAPLIEFLTKALGLRWS